MVRYQDHPAKLDVSEVVILLLICCAESFYSRGSSYVLAVAVLQSLHYVKRSNKIPSRKPDCPCL